MSICLVMIVKNETRVIGRCLTSVRPYISRYTIIDTGSTDETEKIIRLTLEDIPGEIYHRPWKDFASNRNEALELARWDPNRPRRDRTGDDYALVIDADDTLEVLRRDIKLTAPGYAIEVKNGDLSFWRTHLFRLDAGYVYRGVVHEVLVGPQPTKLEGVLYHCGGGGGRSAEGLREKFLRDAATLEAVGDKTPRDVYYLAQSWRDAGVLDKARDAYARRIFDMPDREMFDEETFSAALELAKLEERLEAPAKTVIEAYLTAHAIRPTRREALWHLARYAKSRAALIEKPNDALFLEAEVYAERHRKPGEKFSVVVPEAPHAEAFAEVKLGLEKALGDRHDPNGTPIIVGPHRLREPPPRDAILYNFEQVATQSQYERLLWLVQSSDCEVWDYSKANVAWWRKHGVLAKHVEVGYVDELTRIPQADEDIDVLFYGAAHPRRRHILNELRERGLKVEARFGCYSAERDALIARSKVVLNIHYYEPGQFEISRVSYLLANKKCVVSETGVDDDFGGGVLFAPYDKLAGACEAAVKDETLRRRVAEEGFRLFSARSQAAILASAINASTSAS